MNGTVEREFLAGAENVRNFVCQEIDGRVAVRSRVGAVWSRCPCDGEHVGALYPLP